MLLGDGGIPGVNISVFCAPRVSPFSALCILTVCFFVPVLFFSFSSTLFALFHCFPSNLRLKSKVLGYLIVLPDA